MCAARSGHAGMGGRGCGEHHARREDEEAVPAQPHGASDEVARGPLSTQRTRNSRLRFVVLTSL